MSVAELSRRELLAASAAVLAYGAASGQAASLHALPFVQDQLYPPETPLIGSWHYFTASEGAAIEALVDRLIPADSETPGGRDMGCAIYIDRQLAGPYGRSEGEYRGAPFQKGTKQQGPQSAMTPARRYREGLAALDRYCRQQFAGKSFVQLTDEQKDQLLHGLEDDKVKLEGDSGHEFFEQLLKDTQQGFFADPIYGGNKDMAAWKMIGFPGARYDYRDWVDRHNERFPLPPVGIAQHPDWKG
jgi:gluconate 2-dehydrogenase gamma chain